MKRTGEPLSVRLSRSGDERVRAEAERLGISPSEVVRRLVDVALAEKKSRERPKVASVRV